jgi:replication fork clamp-binding protein CrfC
MYDSKLIASLKVSAENLVFLSKLSKPFQSIYADSVCPTRSVFSNP